MFAARQGFRFMDGGSLDGPDVDVIDMMMEQGFHVKDGGRKPRRNSGKKTITEEGEENMPDTTAAYEANRDREVLEACGATVGRVIVSGSFGAVYACSIDGEPGEFAVKVARGTSGKKASRELQQLWLRLQHQHLVQLLRVVCMAPLCLAYEMCPGGTLTGLLRASPHCRALTPRQRLRVATEVVSAAAYLHENGVIHRDIQPDNVFFSQPVGADCVGVQMPPAALGYLGLEGLSEEGSNISQSIGSVRYMAPEVISESPYLAPADVFSCGMLLYEVCSLAVPFGQRTGDTQVLLKIAAGMRPGLQVLQSFGGGRELACTVERAWSQAPSRRMAAAELEGTLSGLLATLP